MLFNDSTYVCLCDTRKQGFALGGTFVFNINLLKSTGHVIHHPFNIQQLYALPTLYLYVLYLSENKQQLAPRTA